MLPILNSLLSELQEENTTYKINLVGEGQICREVTPLLASHHLVLSQLVNHAVHLTKRDNKITCVIKGGSRLGYRPEAANLRRAILAFNQNYAEHTGTGIAETIEEAVSKALEDLAQTIITQLNRYY